MRVKSAVRRLIERALEPNGLSLRAYHPEIKVRATLSPGMQHRQRMQYRLELMQSLADFPELRDTLPPDEEIKDFIAALSTSPIQQAGGGSSFSAAILLWTLTRALRPSCIVESGVFRGFTTWVLRQAQPYAQQFAFDISFAERQRIEAGGVYHEHDWMHSPVRLAYGEAGLIFFDDHMSQWQRIREAAQRGFRYLVFDDNLPAQALCNDGLAAAPTIDMLFDDSLADGEELHWRTECGEFHYRHSMLQAQQTRKLVSAQVRLPDLRYVFGYAPANLTLVRLKQGITQA